MQQCSCISTQDENENLSCGLSCESAQDDCDGRMKNEKQQNNQKSFVVKIKTEICKYWSIEGYCPYGKQCAFAHGKHEIRRKTHVPRNYKTQICKNYTQDGYCCYGERCQFKHPEKKGIKLPSLTYQNILDNIDNLFKNNNLKLIKNQKRSRGLPYKL